MKTFLLAIFAFAGMAHQSVVDVDRCASLKLKAETRIPSGASNGAIVLQAEGGSSPYKFVVYRSSGHLLSEDFSKNQFENLSADVYHAIVIDENGCRQQLEIQLK